MTTMPNTVTCNNDCCARPVTGNVVHLATERNKRLVARYLEWRVQYNDWPSASTVEVRTNQLNRLVRWCDQHDVDLIHATREQLRDWVNTLTCGADAKASFISAVRGLYEYMVVELEMREDDPTRRLRRPKIRKREPRPMPDELVERVLIYASGDDTMFALWALIFCCGLRCHELAGLTVACLERHGTDHRLYVLGKGNKGRKVPVEAGVLEVVRPFARGTARAPMFPRPSDGRHHTPNGLSLTLNKFLHRECGIEGYTPHCGRHTWASDYHTFDPDIFRQARLMGHESTETTALYTRVDPADAAEPMRQLAEYRLAPVRRRRTAS